MQFKVGNKVRVVGVERNGILSTEIFCTTSKLINQIGCVKNIIRWSLFPIRIYFNSDVLKNCGLKDNKVWGFTENELVLVKPKNEQLLFNFMLER